MPNIVNSLKRALSRLHNSLDVQVIETHISWVFLTGDIVYKVKKPVNLGFVDFTTLEKRHFYCLEELRLNKRLAPELYIDVVSITHENDGVTINGLGSIIDFAVRLNQFDINNQLDVLISHHKLNLQHIQQLAAIIADFHQVIKHTEPGSHFGEPQTIHNATMDSYQHCLELLRDPQDIHRINELKTWSEREYEKIHNFLAARKSHGFVRECHGDLHLGNITIFKGRLTPFDCIEFNPEFRWIDVISEISFLVMDLIARGREDMAAAFLNEYLTRTGDFAGVMGMRYYLVYRSMVRAKVEIIRARQTSREPKHEHTALSNYHHFTELANTLRSTSNPLLIIMHGLSGSGKSTVASKLQQYLFFIHLRSDVERKRLYRLQPTEKSDSGIDRGIYSTEATQKTYDRLFALADTILRSRWIVVVDATFLQHQQRERFHQLAALHNAAFIILDCTAPQSSLEQRIISRATEPDAVSEANLEVLHQQITTDQPITSNEQKFCVAIDTDQAINFPQLAATISRKSI